MHKDENHLTPYRRQILSLIGRGQTPLDPRLGREDRRQVLWGADFLFEKGMIEFGFRITPKGREALMPKPVAKREGNPQLNAMRRDKCFMCVKRSCHLRIWLPGYSFDEVACDEHADDLRAYAESRLSVWQKHAMRVVVAPDKLRRERRSGP